VFGAAMIQVQPSLVHAASRRAVQAILTQRLLSGPTANQPSGATAEAPHQSISLRAQLRIVGIQHQQAV